MYSFLAGIRRRLRFGKHAVSEVTTAATVVFTSKAVNTWLFKVLQVDLVLVFSDVLMPAHHHYRKLELRKKAQKCTLLHSPTPFTCRKRRVHSASLHVEHLCVTYGNVLFIVLEPLQ